MFGIFAVVQVDLGEGSFSGDFGRRACVSIISGIGSFFQPQTASP